MQVPNGIASGVRGSKHHLLASYFLFLSLIMILSYIKYVIFALSCPRLHNCCGEWDGWDSVYRFKPYQLGSCRYSNWPSEVGPQSLCNRLFCLRFDFSCCHVVFFLYFSVDIGVFVIWLSQISSYFSDVNFILFSLIYPLVKTTCHVY